MVSVAKVAGTIIPTIDMGIDAVINIVIKLIKSYSLSKVK